MQIFNTLSGKKEKLEKPEGKTLNLFVCGPTVYDNSHIGHAKTYLAFDMMVRYLRLRDYKIFYLQNITDIDDKIIARAQEQNTTAPELADKFYAEYRKDMKSLGIASVDKYARATEYLPQIISQVRRLSEKGFAYKIEGDGYYFDIAKFPDYGKLSRRTASGAEDAVSRIDESVNKKNKGDFALWKFSESGEPSWDSELGKGRPGWHIEDTAITEKEFGSLQYDLHGGAVDLKFPHHEAEIAQAEALSGRKPFVKMWLHTGFLLVGGEKMSKSKGNFMTIKDFLKKYRPEVLRLLVLAHHYRSPLDYAPQSGEEAKNSFSKISEFLEKLELVSLISGKKEHDPKIKEAIAQTSGQWEEALEDDFNTPLALAQIFSLMAEFQEKIWEMSDQDAKKLKLFIMSALATLGLEFKPPTIPLEIVELSEKREDLRRHRKFAEADGLRKRAEEAGYNIEDTPLGPFIWPR